MLIHAKTFCQEEIATLLFPYALKEYLEKLNELTVDDDGIISMEKFACTTKDITVKMTTHRALKFMW